MADEADSSDVIGVSHAAAFDPGTPGRAMAKSGPGRLEMFQSAYAGGHSQVAAATVAKVGIHELRFGAIDSWRRPDVFEEASLSDLGPTDQQRLVASVGGAARLASVASPRRPWLPDLSKIYDLELLAPRSDAELILGVADFPDRQAQELCYFRPDVDGNLAIYGTAGSGKSAALRTLGVAAGITPRGGPVHVYGLDFGAGGLRMLESLPQVGAVVAGDDHERVVRLLRNLRELADARGRAFPSCHAGNITEYRRLAGRPDEARILLLIDNFPAFREAYEVGGSRQQYYVILQQLLSEGRSLGIHVVFTADRHASVPGSMAAAVPRRVVLRLAEDVGYMALGVPNDVLDLTSPPGRAIIDGQEVQLALFGGSGNVADQSEAIGKLAADMRRRGIPEAPPVLSLPQEIPDASLPSAVNGWPVLGVSDETLEPVGFEPVGSFIVGGGPGSGRSNALLVLARSLRCWDEDLAFVYLGGRRSALPDLHPWDVVATDVQEVADVAKQLTEALAGPGRTKRMAIFIEGVSELVTTVADAPLVQLARAVKRSEHLIVAESETATWASIYPLYAELKSSRRGILLQPDHLEGDAIMKTPFPRAHRSEFPVGRGMAVMAGRATRVQVPLATGERSPSPGSPRTSTVETRASNANQLPNQEDQDVQR
ncbi:MAG: FtsK/SpoIIIE domain-containing protein [Nocardioides sp.]